MKSLAALLALGLSLTACADSSRMPESAQTGPTPQMPETTSSALATVKIAPAKGWPQGRAPKAAPGFAVAAYAGELRHPRWLYVLPNGDVLVAETAAPP